MGKKKKEEVSDVKAEDQKQEGESTSVSSLETKIAKDRKAAPETKAPGKEAGAKKSRVVSEASAKSFAAKRLAMAMINPKRGWKEVKQGIYEKGGHSVSFNTDGHFVEVDGKFQLALGQGAIKLLDKHLEADTPPAAA